MTLKPRTDVLNRDISGHTKKTCVLKIKKKQASLLRERKRHTAGRVENTCCSGWGYSCPVCTFPIPSECER